MVEQSSEKPDFWKNFTNEFQSILFALHQLLLNSFRITSVPKITEVSDHGEEAVGFRVPIKDRKLFNRICTIFRHYKEYVELKVVVAQDDWDIIFTDFSRLLSVQYDAIKVDDEQIEVIIPRYGQPVKIVPKYLSLSSIEMWLTDDAGKATILNISMQTGLKKELLVLRQEQQFSGRFEYSATLTEGWVERPKN